MAEGRIEPQKDALAMAVDQSPLQPPTVYDKAAWILMGAGLLFTLVFQLVPALLAGLFTFALVHALAARLKNETITHRRAKLIAVAFIGLLITAAAAGLVLLLIAFAKGKFGGLPILLDKMAAIIESIRERLGLDANWLPVADELRISLAHTLRAHIKELQHIGSETGRTLVQVFFGMVIGGLSSFESRPADALLAGALVQRLSLLAWTFQKVFFAQIRISALNTLFTAIFLLGILPSCGIELPLRKTLVAETFVTGLVPIVGNLVSNSAIIIMALGVSVPVTLAALAFLVGIHKLEYFFNAWLMGGQLRAAAWEILLAMLCFEAAFGIPGLIVAPIIYGYLKAELARQKLI